eukprot:3042532-Rhodomonas_salina.2
MSALDRSASDGDAGDAGGETERATSRALPADAPRIRHYIAALGASGAHQKLVMKGDGSKREDDVKGEKLVQRARLDRGVPSQRRVVQKKKNQQTMVDIMVRVLDAVRCREEV